MARFGCRAGVSGLVLVALVAGCSEDTPTPPTSAPSAGGSATDFATLEQRVGRVLVIGESAGVPHFEHEYRGSTTPGSGETVSCDYTKGPDGVTLRIEAGRIDAAASELQATFRAPSLEPTKFDAVWSPEGDQNLRVRLGEGTAFQYHEYQFGSVGEQLASRCNIVVSKLDPNQLVGIAACRALVATPSSIDSTAQGGADDGPATASVTLDFSCPFKALSDPGGSGGSASGGSGGSNNGGGGASSAGGSVGTGGSAAGGNVGVTKHCVGITTPCSSRGSVTCELGTGCTLDETCSGLARSCYGQFSVYSCTDIQGCYWASSSKTCSGSAWSCSLFDGSSSCIGQPGCDWSSDCKGIAPLCSELSEFTCELESGCHWE
jgi:hypothetical protein